MVWMDAVGAALTAWLHVGGGRDGFVDAGRRLWTTSALPELSPTRPRVVHRSGAVHPRPWNRPSTELSPDVGEVCAHGDVERPTGDRGAVSPTAGNRWSSPRVHGMKRAVTGSVTATIIRSGGGAVSVVGGTTSGRVSCEQEDRVLAGSPSRRVAAGCGQRRTEVTVRLCTQRGCARSAAVHTRWEEGHLHGASWDEGGLPPEPDGRTTRLCHAE